MGNFWKKIKNLFSLIWDGLTKTGRIIMGLIMLAAIIFIAFVFAKDTDENKHDNTPEVTQVYEPSIGDPLPPDVIASETSFVAPSSGIDDNKPIKYDNSTLKFAAILPAYSKVNEQTDTVKFTSSEGVLHYIVSVNNAGTENLASIESQLRNSPTASNISYTTIANTKALKFKAKGFGTGIAFIANNKVYYLLGNHQYFADFKLL